MLRLRHGFLLGCVVIGFSGCTLVEVRSKSKVGPEFRHNGPSRKDLVRWYVQQGFEFIWKDESDRKITSGVTYRRRDMDNGDSTRDNGVWFDFSFPVWRIQSDRVTAARRTKSLERRIAALEAERDQALAETSGKPATRYVKADSRQEIW